MRKKIEENIFLKNRTEKHFQKNFSTKSIDLFNKALKAGNAAKEQYQQIITIEPEFIPAYNNLAEIMITEKMYTDAGQILGTALKIISKKNQASEVFSKNMSLMLRLNLAIAFFSLEQNWENTIKILKSWPLTSEIKNHSANPFISKGQLMYGESLYYLGYFTEAIPYLKKSLEIAAQYNFLGNKDSISEILAHSYYNSKQFDKALDLYEKIVKPSSSFSLRQKKGMALLLLGRYEQAEKYLTEILDDFLEKDGNREKYKNLLEKINSKEINIEELAKKLLNLEEKKSPSHERKRSRLFQNVSEKYKKAKEILHQLIRNIKK